MNRNRILLVGAVALILLITGVKLYANSKARSEVDEAVEKASRYAEIEYGNVKGKIFNGSAVINDVKIAPTVGSGVQEVQKEIKVDRIEVGGSGFNEEDVLKSLSISFQGIEMDTEDMEPQDRQIMRHLGYEGVMRVNLEVDFDYQKKEERLSVHDVSFGIDELGELALGMDLGKIKLDENGLVSLLFTYPQILMSDLQIAYEDDSFLPRLMEYGAKQEGMSTDEFKKRLASNIEKEIRAADTKFARESLEKLQEFVQEPKRISISASPDEPQSVGKIMRIQKPDDLIEVLKIRVKL